MLMFGVYDTSVNQCSNSLDADARSEQALTCVPFQCGLVISSLAPENILKLGICYHKKITSVNIFRPVAWFSVLIHC